jgi:hypothetical protein
MPAEACAPPSWSRADAWLMLAPSMVPRLDAEAWLADAPERLEQAAAAAGGRVLGNGRGAARAVELGEDRVPGVWRINRHGGLFARLGDRRYRSAARLKREVCLVETLRRAKLPTPEVLLAYAHREGMWWQQHLVTAEVEGACTLFAAAEEEAALDAARRLMARLFAVGLWATDLHPDNLLWQPDQGTCWVIDLAGARLLGRPLRRGERRARVERFLRYFDKHAGRRPAGAERFEALVEG